MSNNEIPYFLTQRNWECQAGMECIMHPGKELGQCVDIDECTASVLYLTPCFALLKYCRSSHHQRSRVFLLKLLMQDPRFIDASLAYCGQNTTCTNRSNDKTSLYFQTKRIHCYEKRIPTLLTFAALARSRALATQDSPVSKERCQVLPALLS